MKFLLIAMRPQTLPFAVSIDDESVEGALRSAEGIESEQGFTTFLFLIDMESGSASRMVRNAEDGWAISDTAFDQLGVATPDEWFAEQEV